MELGFRLPAARSASQEYVMYRKSILHSAIMAIFAVGCLLLQTGLAEENGKKTTDPAFKEKFSLNGKKPTDYVFSISVSPDGRYLAVATKSGVATVWEITTGKEKQSFQADGDVGSMAWNPKGTQLVTALKGFFGKERNKIICWDLGSGRQVFSEKTDAKIPIVAFHPGGKEFAVACSDRKQSEIRNSENGAIVRYIDQLSVYGVAYDSEGEKLALAVGGAVKITDAKSGKVVVALKGHNKTAAVRVVSYSASGKLIASVALDKSVKIWDAEKGTVLRDIPMAYQVHMVALSPNGKWVAIGGSVESKITLHDAETGRKICDLLDVPFGATGLAFSRDGTMLAASGGFHVRVWEITEPKTPAEKGK
jgi:WD40 repeat protein